ncbi:hypothetical protein DICPUDRAFT_81101 [Dictyostelium purpureum]|uniref:Uncharacterized protein n=1 Tax=Dictyostelium purpureum TaxID=5786 RepID=F0ZSH4_DICPU|nr:uncharacterized protein DICPUDRAFT_81101 [Dictyostelium purpureum]EGC33090.1 hypothetical protein DICPUDRAFT_81101 [Dictyostelium purpureum]|eukprot:XP_003290367.1 hypothetical protein DICPUDRAFT_81101 [Dictyostelium purpureum]
MLFSNIIYNSIIRKLIFFLYKRKFKLLPIEYVNESYEYFRNLHCETIKYCLVSKYWKQLVSKHLTNVLDFKNGSVLLSFIGEDKWKLIKEHSSLFFYDSIQSYNEDEGYRLKFRYRKMLINSYGDSFESFLNSSQKFQRAVYFNIILKIDMLTNQTKSKPLVPKKVKRLVVSGFDTSNEDQKNKALEIINSIQPNQLFLFFTNEYNQHFIPSLDLSKYFLIPSLKKFNTNMNYLEPIHLLSLDNRTTKLKTLHLRMKFNEMIKLLNGQQEYANSFTYPDHIQHDWSLMIKKLIENNTIINLILNSFSNNYPSNDEPLSPLDQDFKTSYLTEGFKSLFSNPKCTIKTLQLVSINFIDQLFLDGLALNTSISTLIIFNDIDYISIINHILPKNKTIRNLIFVDVKNDKFFIFLQILNNIINNNNNNNNNSNTLELYSISFGVESGIDENTLEKVINEIKLCQYPIKEWNIYINKNIPNPQILLENNTIINLKHHLK